MISVEKLKEIKELGIEIDHKQAFDGKSHGNQHLFRAVKIAKYLSEKIDCRSDIVEASAWLHDTALPSGDDYNYENNKKIIVEILESINISPADKSAILSAIDVFPTLGNPATNIIKFLFIMFYYILIIF